MYNPVANISYFFKYSVFFKKGQKFEVGFMNFEIRWVFNPAVILQDSGRVRFTLVN